MQVCRFDQQTGRQAPAEHTRDARTTTTTCGVKMKSFGALKNLFYKVKERGRERETYIVIVFVLA